MPKKNKKNDEFWNTIHDIRRMTEDFTNQNKSKVFKLHNTKKKVTTNISLIGKRS